MTKKSSDLQMLLSELCFGHVITLYPGPLNANLPLYPLNPQVLVPIQRPLCLITCATTQNPVYCSNPGNREAMKAASVHPVCTFSASVLSVKDVLSFLLSTSLA